MSCGEEEDVKDLISCSLLPNQETQGHLPNFVAKINIVIHAGAGDVSFLKQLC